MAGSKSLASLTPTLLARKGGAKPAMRPQLHPIEEFQEAEARDLRETGDDLGWNDMGEDEFEEDCGDTSAEVVSIAGETQANGCASLIPEVVEQQVALSTRLNGVQQPRRSAQAQGRRAAFTLRLDPDRHLKLRLASAVLNRSAQDIVTEALDGHLRTLGEVEALAAEVRKSS